MRVLLLREPSAAYADLLLQNGWEAVFLPPLEFSFVNAEVLERALRCDDYSGIVFTSPRAVEACARRAAKDEPLWERWRRRPAFAVGESTANLARDLLGLECQGGEAGNADKLADYITSLKDSIEGRLLFPSGNLRRETLPERLRSAGIGLEPLTAYETGPRPCLREDLARLRDEHGVPQTLVFFSPSGVDLIAPELTLSNGSRIVAIGPSTEARLQKWNLDAFGVAAKPTPQAIVDILNQIDI